VRGHPAECERIALVQAEYRGDIFVSLGEPWESDTRHFMNVRRDWQWVVFADAGRGWLTGPGAGPLAARGLPSLSSFRSDLGAGLDLGGVGIYAAKGVSTPGEPINVILRLQRRF
jgi:hypothetical protein